jgi:hypothetical protein
MWRRFMRNLVGSIFILSALFAISGSASANVDADRDPYAMTAEDQKFVDEFIALLNKYPKQANRFSLADVGTVVAMTHVEYVWSCSYIFGELKCVREHPRQ